MFIAVQELKYSPFAATGKLPEFPFESSSTKFQNIFKEKAKIFIKMLHFT